MAVSDEDALAGYLPSEVRALMEHKYFLGIERGYDPPLAEVIASWEARYASAWRCQKMRRDAEAQVREIEAFREKLATQRGCPITFRDAAKVWVEECESEWRRRWEASPAASL